MAPFSFSVGLFLALNGYRLVITQAEATVAVFALAAGELEETEFTSWLRSRLAGHERNQA